MACASRSHSIRFSSAAFAMAGLRVGLVKCSNRATGSMFRARRQVDAPDRMVDDRIAAPQHSLAGGDGGGGPMRESGLVERTGRRALVTGGSRGLGLEIGRGFARAGYRVRSKAHVELQSLMRISYAVFCLKKKKYKTSNMEDVMSMDQTVTKITI